MKITAITVYQVDLPFVDGPYVMAEEKSVSVADSTVARLDTDEGLTGWGEACPLGPFYLPSYPEGPRAGVGVPAGHVIGLDPTRYRGDVAILPADRYYESARDLADGFAVMERGGVAASGGRASQGRGRCPQLRHAPEKPQPRLTQPR